MTVFYYDADEHLHNTSLNGFKLLGFSVVFLCIQKSTESKFDKGGERLHAKKIVKILMLFILQMCVKTAGCECLFLTD